jgi:hypothetical protein
MTESSTPMSPTWRLMQLAEQAKILYASRDQLRRYIESWTADRGYQYVEQVFMDPKARGKDLFYISKAFFWVDPPKAQARPAKSVKCTNCNDSGLVAGAVVDGRISMEACRCKRKSSRAE